MSDNLIPVVETFLTIQGEGVYVGRPSYFVRTGGCGYRCRWCDSMHAVDPVHADTWQRMSPAAIIEAVQSNLSPGGVVVLTGGDPCIHKPLGVVVEALTDQGYLVQVETQGAHNADWLRWVDTICLSPKPPSSGMITNFATLDAIIERATATGTAAFLKVPVGNAEDMAFADRLAERYPDLQMYVQPVNPTPGTEIGTDVRLATYDALIKDVLSLRLRHTWAVLPQLHVLVWGNRRGV